MTAVTIMPALPQEDLQQIEERTQEWIDDVQPRNAIERELTGRAARLSLTIDRAERTETAHLSHRVHEATRERTQQVSLRRLEEVRELGRRLLYIAGPEEVKVERQPLWDNDPRRLVSQLEATAEGCRWLLERWAEFRILLDRRSQWEVPVLLRFIRLQGKQVVESVYDPALNSIFVAWDVLVPKYAAVEWQKFREERPPSDPAFNHRLRWREIAPRPSDRGRGVGGTHRDRRSARGPAQGAAGQERGHRSGRRPRLGRPRGAGLQPGVRAAPAVPVGQDAGAAADARHAAENAECGMRNGEWGSRNADWEMGRKMPDGECQMADGKCQMAEGEPQVAEGEPQVTDEQCEGEAGGRDEGQRSEPMAEETSSPLGGHDSDSVLEDSTNDNSAIVSQEGADTDAAEQPGQGDGDVKSPQKAPNEAIYERPVVKRGGADFVSQGSRTSPSPSASVDLAHLRPVRRRFRCAPRNTSSEPEAEGELPPSVPAVYEALTDVT